MILKKLLSFVINDKTSIRVQLFSCYVGISLITVGITLCICYAMIYSLADSAETMTRETLIDTTKDSITLNSNEIAQTLNQELSLLGNSICMVESLYLSLLYNTTSLGDVNSNSTLLPIDLFKEYKFSGHCDYPDCPEDYGKLYGRSRFPYLPGFINGSIKSSSVYLYSSASASSIQDDTTWELAVSNPTLQRVINQQSYLDNDFGIIYANGPNTTVMFYASTKVFLQDEYYVSHRTFPGIVKNVSNYDPSKRSWFLNAPVDAFYLYGPYRETFTRQLVLTISSKKILNVKIPSTGQTASAEVVVASVVLLDDLQKMISSVQYIDDGFGVLLRLETFEVLVWKNSSFSTFDNETSSFFTLDHFDPVLASYDIVSNNIIEYTDKYKTDWIVSSNPFFSTQQYGSPVEQDSLIMLVFAKKDLAMTPLTPLTHNIQSTTSKVASSTIILCAIIFIVEAIIVIAFISIITGPLDSLLSISSDIVKIVADFDELRDYSSCIANPVFHSIRYDEIGLLLLEFYNIVCKLHRTNEEKKNTPKNPVNVFCMDHNEPISWKLFTNCFLSPMAVDQACMGNRTTKPASVVIDDLDILGAMNQQTSQGQQLVLNKDDHISIDIHEESSSESVSKKYFWFNEYRKIVPENIKKSSIFLSLKAYLWLINIFLLVGIILIMIFTAFTLRSEGVNWMESSSPRFIENAQMDLASIALIKSTFVKSFFMEYGMNSMIAASYLSNLYNNAFTNLSYVSSGNYLQSYSLDSSNPYASSLSSSYDFSGYFFTGDASCNSTVCATYQDGYSTRLTSLMDIKYRSLFHSNNIISFIQTGSEDGLTRYLPYAHYSHSTPASCTIQNVSRSYCFSAYQNSACNPSSGISTYPPYDVRCRSWYDQGALLSSNAYYVQSPRISSSGIYVVTFLSTVKSAINHLQAVFNMNIKGSVLSDSLNEVTIMSNGYTFMVSGENVTNVIIHPRASTTCMTVMCCEGFESVEEYQQFYDEILFPIQSTINTGIPSYVSTSYQKKTERWQIQYSSLSINNQAYVVLAVVPDADVLHSSDQLSSSILSTVTIMIVVFVFAVILFLVLVTSLMKLLELVMIQPFNSLHKVCIDISNNVFEDITSIPCESKDMKVLLNAFSNLIVALRFGHELFNHGDINRARFAFQEALALYLKTKNEYGIGISSNNLAAAYMTLNDLQKAESLYIQAIDSASKCRDEHPHQKNMFERVWSDRRGNLALLYLESQRYGEAFPILEELLIHDRDIGYLRGCVVKQGILGHYYLKQGEISSARKVFESALLFLRTQESVVSGQESIASEQIAMYNLAFLEEILGNDPTTIVQLYLEALCYPRYSHPPTVVKILLAIRNIFVQSQDLESIVSLDDIASKYHWNLKDIIGNEKSRENGLPKRIVFCLDYSGSMSGGKIRSAVSNLRSIIQDHMSSSDSLSLIRFCHEVTIDVRLKVKGNQDVEYTDILANWTSPCGNTALYDAIASAVSILEESPSCSDWIVALTDGEDNASRRDISTLSNLLRTANANLILIGVGNVDHEKCQILTSSSRKGLFIPASDNASGIDEAFGKALTIIHGQILLEDM